MKYDFVYDSSKMSGEKNYVFKPEDYDTPVISLCIFFEKENLCLKVDEAGYAIFSDGNGVELYREKADGRGCYFSECYCKVGDGVISVRFPIQEIVDHYPNCDGEYDRYSYITKDNVLIDYKL